VRSRSAWTRQASVGEEGRRETEGIQYRDDVLAIVIAVRAFDDFHEGNDPHGEHDMALFDWQGERMLWKIDTYDANFEYGAEDSTDPSAQRIMTIMYASEY
jgi:Protein of unknown function (DUF3768)